VAWTVAGTDPTSGAGIQVDLRVMQALGVHGCSVITALVAQNAQGVRAIEYPSATMVNEQLAALAEDAPPAAVKLGMLARASTVTSVARQLSRMDTKVVCDPVLSSTSGTALLEPEGLAPFVSELLPQVDLLTPNLPEAEKILGREIGSPAGMVEAAEALLALGPGAVLLKGGHAAGPLAQDYYTDGRRGFWLSLPRLEARRAHGTGCVLSSAITAARAQGYDDTDAVVAGRAYVQQGLRTGGTGSGGLGLGGWPATPADLPGITDGPEPFDLEFPDCGPLPLGLYPIVDRTAWLERLLPRGITAVQLRVKDMPEAEAAREIAEAIAYARRFPDCRLFINDQWPLAIEHGAYGVHLGQDDLETADLGAIHAAGLRLGISTHSHTEIARAAACHPSYLAIGTVYRTSSKVMDYEALGVPEFRRLRALVGLPVVAIGGINLERAPEVLAAGADGLAVISEVTRAEDLEARLAKWKQFLESRRNASTLPAW
jgi:hydroxymethylpyrimidine kinase/phosphomethylpyrimidine kinase/thiamine-phosphate diphosphorylase